MRCSRNNCRHGQLMDWHLHCTAYTICMSIDRIQPVFLVCVSANSSLEKWCVCARGSYSKATNDISVGISCTFWVLYDL